MAFDEHALGALVEESRDLQSDAMRDARSSIPDLVDVREERRHDEIDPAEVASFAQSRSDLVDRLGLSTGAKVGLAGGIGALLTGILAAPAAADTKLDVAMLQTASSLEVLAVATYGAALTLPFIKTGNQVVVKFAETTQKQHDEHRKAFQAQTKALGAKKQTKANPRYGPIVEAAKPTLMTPLDVVNLAATLEEVATETYLADLGMLTNTRSKQVMASVMAVETQHLATLRAVRALLQGNAANLIAIPTNVAALPAAAGSVGFPDAFQATDNASPAQEGALR